MSTPINHCSTEAPAPVLNETSLSKPVQSAHKSLFLRARSFEQPVFRTLAALACACFIVAATVAAPGFMIGLAIVLAGLAAAAVPRPFPARSLSRSETRRLMAIDRPNPRDFMLASRRPGVLPPALRASSPLGDPLCWFCPECSRLASASIAKEELSLAAPVPPPLCPWCPLETGSPPRRCIPVSWSRIMQSLERKPWYRTHCRQCGEVQTRNPDRCCVVCFRAGSLAAPDRRGVG